MKRWLWAVLVFLGCQLPPLVPPPEPVLPISEAPSYIAAPGWEAETVSVQISTLIAPSLLGEHYKPIGKVYEVAMTGQPSPVFTPEMAQLRFPYRANRLRDEGYLTEFAVYYYDALTSLWKAVDSWEVDEVNGVVVAYVSHLTPFVLTALPESQTASTTPEPPAGINDDFPLGIGGTGGAIFTVVGENYTYYRDRAYTIRPLSTSPANQAVFNALGFNGALGIATANGDSYAGPQSAHKLFTGNDYIVMTAHIDLDVYVLYDTRGGATLLDDSRDAPWLTTSGFSTGISTIAVPTPTRYYVETTDAVGKYKVYKRSYNQGDVIHLHGNRKGVTAPGIQTNYWVIFKRKGVYEAEPAGALLTTPDITPPALVTSLSAILGTGNITLSWTNPSDLDFSGVVIRVASDTPAQTVTEGLAPSGTVLGTESFRATGITPGQSYVYSVFSLDKNLNYQRGGTQVRVTVPSLTPDVSGRVRDQNSSLVGGALVRLTGPGFDEYRVSDTLGYYEFAVVPSGTYTLVAARDGFTLVTLVVIVP